MDGFWSVRVCVCVCVCMCMCVCVCVWVCLLMSLASSFSWPPAGSPLAHCSVRSTQLNSTGSLHFDSYDMHTRKCEFRPQRVCISAGTAITCLLSWVAILTNIKGSQQYGFQTLGSNGLNKCTSRTHHSYQRELQCEYESEWESGYSLIPTHRRGVKSVPITDRGII